ncbi:MAG: hypothetical protein M3Y42_01460 [Actinomycetota bacterium]|nr:hypothetical protein [Actinomycetota bacterium]MDQ2955615.1 hypothetical protein [Actinomycetota bacterium]
MVVLAACLLGYVVRRTLSAATSHGALDRRDLPELLVSLAGLLLGGERCEWGPAMLGELAGLTGQFARWRFALGCLRAALFALPGSTSFARQAAAVIATAGAVCTGLVAYGFARYPGLIIGVGTWLELAAFLAVIGSYLMAAWVVLRRIEAGSVGSIRVALLAGAAIAVVWSAASVLLAEQASGSAFLTSWLAVPFAAFSVGLLGAWHANAARAGGQAALLAAVGAGLLVFGLWVLDTVLSGGRPYDPGLISDFRGSGAPDLATYAVSDNLGSAMMLLLVVPVLATMFGAAGAAIATRLFPHRVNR